MKFRIDHDLHIHSQLSECSSDPAQTPAAILAYGVKNGFHTLCLTDHMWDETVPGAAPWYVPQNRPHVKESLPLPQDKNCRFLFGCETEFDKHFTVAVSPEHYDEFDFIIVPTTHLHMHGLTIDAEEYGSIEGRAYLWVKRFEEFLKTDVPAGKTGIAHLTDGLVGGPGGNGDEDHWRRHIGVVALLKEEDMGRLFTGAAKKNIGIELNMGIFRYTDAELPLILRPYRIAKECGCKFYLGSDAHHPKGLEDAPARFERMVDLLELTEDDKYDFVRR